jgi:hypothetical protein
MISRLIDMMKKRKERFGDPARRGMGSPKSLFTIFFCGDRIIRKILGM